MKRGAVTGMITATALNLRPLIAVNHRVAMQVEVAVVLEQPMLSPSSSTSSTTLNVAPGDARWGL
jgi:hypothetical protein